MTNKEKAAKSKAWKARRELSNKYKEELEWFQSKEFSEKHPSKHYDEVILVPSLIRLCFPKMSQILRSTLRKNSKGNLTHEQKERIKTAIMDKKQAQINLVRRNLDAKKGQVLEDSSSSIRFGKENKRKLREKQDSV